jgi:hypothetical protein
VLQQPFTTRSKIYVRLQATNWSLKRATLFIFDPYFQNRLELFRDGQLAPYKEHMKALLEAKEKDPFTRTGQAVNLEPNESRVIEFIDLADWYDRLQPGHYQLSIKHRFEPGQDWIESSSLTFEVVSNTRESRSSAP